MREILTKIIITEGNNDFFSRPTFSHDLCIERVAFIEIIIEDKNLKFYFGNKGNVARVESSSRHVNYHQ